MSSAPALREAAAHEARLSQRLLVRDEQALRSLDARHAKSLLALISRMVAGAARVKAHKTGVACLVPLADGDVLNAGLAAAPRLWPGPKNLPAAGEPPVPLPAPRAAAGRHTPHWAVKCHTGRKAFATLKIAQGVPRFRVVMTTGHQTAASFSHYPGVSEAGLVAWYWRKTARRAA